MTTTNISPLGGIYREEAVRHLAVKTPLEFGVGRQHCTRAQNVD